MSDDTVCCEACGTHIRHGDACYSEGCFFCQNCMDEWRAEIAACAHQWQPWVSEHGEAGRICDKCGGAEVQP